MRTPRRMRQRMYYSLLIRREPEYELDDHGNIVYILAHGEMIPKKTGQDKEVYGQPVKFFNSVSGQLTENELQAFGTQHTASAKMTYKRAQYPFKTGTLIWKQSEVKFLPDGSIDPASADFRVMGVMIEGQYFWKCILEALSNNETTSKS